VDGGEAAVHKNPFSRERSLSQGADKFDSIRGRDYNEKHLWKGGLVKMALRPILLLGNPILRQKARKVQRFDEALQKLIEDMIDTMREAKGIGLAAPQVGSLERVIVVELPQDGDEPQSGKLFALCNPEIIKAKGEEEGEEGCLSIPGYVGEVKRAARVTIKGQDRHGKAVRIKAQGLLARVFQHEIDHLDGILFIDRVESPDKLWRVVPPEEEGQAEAQPTVEKASLQVEEPLRSRRL